MNKPIKIAVVGLGRAGWSIHLEQIKVNPDFAIIGAVDLDEGRRKEASDAFACATYSDIDSLIEQTDAEVIVVATPSFAHEGDAVKVMESGRHCVLEKPMALDHAGSVRIAEAAQRTDRKLFVHQQYTLMDEVRYLREVIDEGKIGEVFGIRMNWSGYGRRNDWQTLKKNGGGLLNNHGTHILSLALYLLDSKLIELTSDLAHIKDAGDTEDHFHIYGRGENGRSVDLFVSTSCAVPLPRTVLLGANGGLIAQDAETATIRSYDPEVVDKLSVIEGAVAGRKYGIDEELPWVEETFPMKPKAPAGTFYENISDVLLNGGVQAIPPESAVEVMRVIEIAKKGVRSVGQIGGF
jgi:scyllo-inositol 2-dehydrogenase (NADP+)